MSILSRLYLALKIKSIPVNGVFFYLMLKARASLLLLCLDSLALSLLCRQVGLGFCVKLMFMVAGVDIFDIRRRLANLGLFEDGRYM